MATLLTADGSKKKYLVYEAFGMGGGPVWKAVEADGKHGLMDGIALESHVYSWYADSAEGAISSVTAMLAKRVPHGAIRLA